MSQVTVKQLIANKSHFGHKPSKLHPMMRSYVWEKAGKISVINLAKTVSQINKACVILEKVLGEGGQVLWVGTKTQAKDAVKSISDSLANPYVIHRWIGGTLTNHQQVKKAVTKLLHTRDIVEKPLEHLKKKEIVMLKKELGRLEKNVNGIVSLRERPSVVVVVDAKRELTAILEAKKEGIPVIGLVDTDSDPAMIDLVIPCNDDSPESIAYVFSMLEAAAQVGVEAYKKIEAEKKKKEDEIKAKAAAVKAAAAKAKKEAAVVTDKGKPVAKPTAGKKPEFGVKRPASSKPVSAPANKTVAAKATVEKPKAEAATKVEPVVAVEVKKPVAKAVVAAKPKAEKKPEAKESATEKKEVKPVAKKATVKKAPAKK